MERHGFIARLRPECRQQYIDAHNQISPELRARYRQAGIRHISLYLRGDVLFMYMEADNWAAARAALATDPVDIAWQKRMGPMKDPDFQEMEEIFRMD